MTTIPVTLSNYRLITPDTQGTRGVVAHLGACRPRLLASPAAVATASLEAVVARASLVATSPTTVATVSLEAVVVWAGLVVALATTVTAALLCVVALPRAIEARAVACVRWDSIGPTNRHLLSSSEVCVKSRHDSLSGADVSARYAFVGTSCMYINI